MGFTSILGCSEDTTVFTNVSDDGTTAVWWRLGEFCRLMGMGGGECGGGTKKDDVLLFKRMSFPVSGAST